ncbi:MAG: CcmD family protein, partial [Bacteroidota bacterium]
TMLKNLFTTCLLFIAHLMYAQGTSDVPQDFMRSIGKIYVVVGVILLIFLGLVFYLWRLDRRLTKLEDQNH